MQEPLTSPGFKKVENYYYQISEPLGKGNFSQVYRGIDSTTKNPVAIKVIKNTSLTSTVAMQLLKNEISILRELHDEHVINCLDVFVSENHHYIVTEFCEGGDVEKLIERNGFLEENSIYKIVYGVHKGLMYLRQLNIVHRDLKPANIFISNSGMPKIADFGFAVKHDKVFKDINIGSPIYMSPEGLLKREYGPKSEVWAFGVLVYEMLHGYPPLSKCQSEAELKEKVLVAPTFRSGISQQAKSFIETCMAVNQKQRISVDQIANTSFMRKIIGEIEGKKDLASTRAFSHSAKNSADLVSEQISTYSSGLAVLHYCRLIHKTTQDHSSIILSQWLLNLCWSLQKIKIEIGDKEENKKLLDTINKYWLKYYDEHKSKGMFVSFTDVKAECKDILDKSERTFHPNGKTNFGKLMVLLRETELLETCCQSSRMHTYAKSSQIEKYLEGLAQPSNAENVTMQNFYPKQQSKSLRVGKGRLITQIPDNFPLILDLEALKDFQSKYKK